MQHRQGIVEVFSTFIHFANDRFSHWAVDHSLRRSIQASLETLSKLHKSGSSEQFWVLYWHSRWQDGSSASALGHLSAYLQEVCYWTAHRAVGGLINSSYRLSDCFQMAIADLPKVLRGFSPGQGASLKTYASISFSNTIRDVLRQRQEADMRTDWGLLRKLSQKRLLEALDATGLPTETVRSYRLAWTCFIHFYTPRQPTGTRQLSRPDAKAWEAIATLYNNQCSKQPQGSLPQTTPEQIERWLSQCATRVRAYLYPSVQSLNAPKPKRESGEMQDDVPAEGESLLNRLIDQEENQLRKLQQAEIHTVLMDAIQMLDPTMQSLLNLYYGQGLTQQQIAQQLSIKQYTVSRRLSSARETLLMTLAKWSQDTLHISLISDVVKHMSLVLEEWLQVYYQTSDPSRSKENP